MATLDELFEQFKKLPDWNLYPMPEVFYSHFNVKKPKPGEIGELAAPHNPPPYVSLNKGGKVEERPPAPGGVREIKEFQSLPVEIVYPEETAKLTDQTSSDTQPDSGQTTLTPPTEHNTKESQPESDHQSPGPFGV